jgi:aldehyde:ferredoxin oxidoreductase
MITIRSLKKLIYQDNKGITCLAEEEIGRSLKWSDAEALMELTRMTGNREGFGNLLAEGS